MAMASGLYGPTLRDILDASALPVNLVGDTIKYQFVSNTYTPNFDTHASETDITNEVTGTGYTTGGEALSTPAVTISSGVLTFDAVDVSLASTTLSSVRGVVLFDDTVTTPTADPLVCAVTFGADYSTSAGTFAITWNASGIFTIDYTP